MIRITIVVVRATAPTLTTTAAKVDVFQFIYDAATLVWRGSTVGLNYT